MQKQLKASRAPVVTHASLTRGAKRKTAAGAFFELLQVWMGVTLSLCSGVFASELGVSSGCTPVDDAGCLVCWSTKATDGFGCTLDGL